MRSDRSKNPHDNPFFASIIFARLLVSQPWVGPRPQMKITYICLPGVLHLTLGQSKATRLKIVPGAHLEPLLRCSSNKPAAASIAADSRSKWQGSTRSGIQGREIRALPCVGENSPLLEKTRLGSKLPNVPTLAFCGLLLRDLGMRTTEPRNVRVRSSLPKVRRQRVFRASSVRGAETHQKLLSVGP